MRIWYVYAFLTICQELFSLNCYRRSKWPTSLKSCGYKKATVNSEHQAHSPAVTKRMSSTRNCSTCVHHCSSTHADQCWHNRRRMVNGTTEVALTVWKYSLWVKSFLLCLHAFSPKGLIPSSKYTKKTTEKFILSENVHVSGWKCPSWSRRNGQKES